MSNRIICIIDMQKDFINGSLGTPEAEIAAKNAIQWLKENMDDWDEAGEYFRHTVKVEGMCVTPTPEKLGTVEILWNQFGGNINSKEYKVLNPHIKAIYGDSITPDRCKEIYARLANKGFAINNVILGVGSFSMMCLESNSVYELKYNPYTRDTFGIAVKATYAEDKNSKPIMIYKQPKALSWKKSQKGMCIVAQDGQSYTDGYTRTEAHGNTENLLKDVFYNGEIVTEYSLDDIRNRLYGGKF